MIPPGRSIGILGGGQLGRMFAIAARRMGYRVHAMEPSPDCPAGQVADVEINRRYDDIDAARNFASHVDVVTFEFENVPAETLEAVEALTPVHPSPHVLHTTRHRLREKTFLRDAGFPHADWREARSAADVAAAAREFNGGILKTALFGYDGKGQVKLTSADDAESAWASLKQDVGVVETLVPFDLELSVIVARGEDGAVRTFPVFENHHANHILDVTLCPARIPSSLAMQAVELAEAVAGRLDLVGIMAIEMFVVGQTLLVNELAPRPHNSGHVTFDFAVTSQFEQQLRAVTGMPLGDPSLTVPAVAMANLLGDLWKNGEPDWAAALADPAVKLHLYGKTDPRPGRKMGHLVAAADSAEAAERTVRNARDRLSV